MCPRQDSNLHTRRYNILSVARLPIPPRGHKLNNKCLVLATMGATPSLSILRLWLYQFASFLIVQYEQIAVLKKVGIEPTFSIIVFFSEPDGMLTSYTTIPIFGGILLFAVSNLYYFNMLKNSIFGSIIRIELIY